MKDWPWYGHLLLIGILAALLYFVWFKPKNVELQNLRAEREKIETEVKDLQKKKRQLDRIEKDIAVLNEKLNELELIIPKRREIWDILRNMQQLAINSRLKIDKFDPKGEIRKEFYFEWPIDLEITGDYHNLALFFDRLSNFSRLFNVEDFSIKALQRQTEATTISATYTAKTYIFREETPAKKGKKAKGR
ncbi:MAG: type 4a pilus biogenesis protein PilO [Candidatus Aminicenantes bacterium]|jgi:Tfp pilus assembly protein PilO